MLLFNSSTKVEVEIMIIIHLIYFKATIMIKKEESDEIRKIQILKA
jgi:hypothetical protein